MTSFGAGAAYRLRVESLLVDALVHDQGAVTYALRDVQALHGSVIGRVGVLVRPWSGFRVGASLTTPGLGLHGAAVISQVALRTGTVAQLVPAQEVPMTYKSPWRIALGVGYRWGNGARAGADVAVHSPIDRYHVIPGVSMAQADVLANVNVGVEVPVTRKLVLRGGVFTNRAATPSTPTDEPADFDDPGRLPHVDYNGATLGASLLSGSSSLDASVAYQYGTGKVPAEAARGYDPFRGHVMVVMLGGTYSFGEEARP
jgi:hypothetical protein